MAAILYFDDDKFQTILCEELSENGFEISQATNINSFFELLNDNKKKYDLFILDILCPLLESEHHNFTTDEIKQLTDGQITGEILFNYVRKKSKYKKTPIIFYSAKNSVSVADANIAFIQKPELVKNILKKIKEMIE